MTYDEKRAKVIGMIDDLYGDDGMAVVNLLSGYVSDDDWADLYNILERDGEFQDKK